MADNELELSGKLGIPEFHGFAARLEGRYKRTWTTRRADFVETTSAAADLSPEALGTRLESDERLGDLFVSACDRASGVADPAYRDALAKVTAAACDDARIDDAAFLMGQLVRMEPLELRILVTTATFWENQPTLGTRQRRDPTQGTYASAGACDAASLRHSLRIESRVIEAAVQGLLANGLLEEIVPRPQTDRGMGGVRLPTPQPRPRWRVSPWGLHALRFMFPNLRDLAVQPPEDDGAAV